jgi:hypothetical protein
MKINNNDAIQACTIYASTEKYEWTDEYNMLLKCMMCNVKTSYDLNSSKATKTNDSKTLKACTI